MTPYYSLISYLVLQVIVWHLSSFSSVHTDIDWHILIFPFHQWGVLLIHHLMVLVFFRHLIKVFLEWRSPTDPPTLLLPGQTLLKIVVKIKMLLLPGMWLKMTNLTQMWQWLWKWEFQECNLTVLNPTHICGCARTWRRPHAAWYGQILTTIFQFSDVIWLISDICNMFHTWRIAAIRALYPLRPCDPHRWTVTPKTRPRCWKLGKELHLLPTYAQIWV